MVSSGLFFESFVAHDAWSAFVTFFIAKKVTMLRHAIAQPCATAQQPWFDLLSRIQLL